MPGPWMASRRCFSAGRRSGHVSDYRQGDVRIHLQDTEDQSEGQCDVGMVTAAALFTVKAGEDSELTVRMPLSMILRPPSVLMPGAEPWKAIPGWSAPMKPGRFVRRGSSFPGAAFAGGCIPRAIYLQALLVSRCRVHHPRTALRRAYRPGRTGAVPVSARQLKNGYFRSQEGEWDANGEVLWILRRFHEITGRPLPGEWQEPVRKGARWIENKRLSDSTDQPHAGLLPAGFSAGPGAQ